MEINRIKIAGNEVNVIFTGKNYFFVDKHFGVIGIADRKGFDNGNTNKFIITAGNKDTERCTIITAMERFISKMESRIIPRKTEYVISEEICNHYLNITAAKY